MLLFGGEGTERSRSTASRITITISIRSSSTSSKDHFVDRPPAQHLTSLFGTQRRQSSSTTCRYVRNMQSSRTRCLWVRIRTCSISTISAWASSGTRGIISIKEPSAQSGGNIATFAMVQLATASESDKRFLGTVTCMCQNRFGEFGDTASFTNLTATLKRCTATSELSSCR